MTNEEPTPEMREMPTCATPDEAGWTSADIDRAISEGWDIFDCDGSDNGPWQICSFNEPEDWLRAPVPYPFTTDTDVWEFLKREEGKTQEQIDFHDHALEVILLLNPKEWHSIMEWVPRPKEQ